MSKYCFRIQRCDTSQGGWLQTSWFTTWTRCGPEFVGVHRSSLVRLRTTRPPILGRAHELTECSACSSARLVSGLVPPTNDEWRITNDGKFADYPVILQTIQKVFNFRQIVENFGIQHVFSPAYKWLDDEGAMKRRINHSTSPSSQALLDALFREFKLRLSAVRLCSDTYYSIKCSSNEESRTQLKISPDCSVRFPYTFELIVDGQWPPENTISESNGFLLSWPFQSATHKWIAPIAW